MRLWGGGGGGGGNVGDEWNGMTKGDWMLVGGWWMYVFDFLLGI